MPTLKKFLALSLPLSLAALFALGSAQASWAIDSKAQESPAQLRLTALDALMKGDKHAALDIYEEAIGLANRQFGSDSTFLGDLYYEAGHLYLELDQFNQAEDYLRQAVKINPKNASARLSLARLLDTREKIQESIGQIREALLINPGSPVARQKFIQTLSKYGQSPSDKAIATQESVTLAIMQKTARAAIMTPGMASADKKSESKAAARGGPKKPGGTPAQHALTVPTMPTNLAPLKDGADQGEDKSDTSLPAAKNDKKSGATISDIKSDSKQNTGEGATQAAPKDPTASPGPSLFPLKDMSERKLKEELNNRIEARTRKKIEDALKNGGSGDVVEKLKEQARKADKARAAERADKAYRQAAKAEAKSKADAKPKSEAKAKAEVKPAEKQNAAKPEQAAPQVQPVPAAPVQQYMPPQMMYTQPVFTAPPKAKAGKGFVPPPPPTMPYGMMPQVMPQVIQQPKPAPAKPKVDKPKAPPKEEAKPAEDKPPPMTTSGDSDPGFLLDWAELKKTEGKKKSK